MDHSNLYHDALTKVHDVAKNGTKNADAWRAVLDIVDGALAESRRRDGELAKQEPK